MNYTEETPLNGNQTANNADGNTDENANTQDSQSVKQEEAQQSRQENTQAENANSQNSGTREDNETNGESDEPVESAKTQSEKDDKSPGNGQDSQEAPQDASNNARQEASEAKTNQEEDKKQTDKTESEEKTPGGSEIKTDEHEESSEEEDSTQKREMPDYSDYSKEQLLAALKKLTEEGEIADIKDEVEIIKTNFYKKHNAEVTQEKNTFIENGGDAEAFEPSEDPLEPQFKELYKQFKQKKKELNNKIEQEQNENLEACNKIIEELKELVNTKESLNQTFQEFRQLQDRWNKIGKVPQNRYKQIWETYNHHIERFYDYVKINKELRDYDLKKNYEEKIKLCEKAEDLLLEEDVVKAYKSLQTLHDRWREIGPVPKDNKEELWNRFKDATRKINKANQEYHEKKKKEREKNLKAKTLLCEKAEELANLSIENHKEWEKRTDEIKELQKIWRSLGFVPKKYNNKIYARFRSANDKFFNRKREFYAELRKEQQENLRKKRELLEQAENMKESTDWKNATDFFKDIQEQWKNIGPAPKKYSDQVWKKFREACNYFFDRKREHFAQKDKQQEENLKKKQELIEEVKNYQFGDNTEENMQKLKEFQRRFSEIGFVPYENKDTILEQFREAINKRYDELRVDDNKLVELKFKNKIENLKKSENPSAKLKNEREKIANKLKKVENDISTWENNINFFTDSKNAQPFIEEMQQKIKDAKQLAEKLRSKLDVIDEADET